VEDHARVEGDETVGRSEQGIDVDFANAWLLHYQVTEANEKLFEPAEGRRRFARERPRAR